MSPDERHTCEACGFDSSLYGRSDTISSHYVVPAMLRAAIEGLDNYTITTRPSPEVWSIGEYLDHCREVVVGNHISIAAAVDQPGIDLGTTPDPRFAEPVPMESVDAVLDAIESEFRALHDLLASLDDEGWAATAILDGEVTSVEWAARHVLHDTLHHFADIGRIRQQLGAGAPTATGSVSCLSVSNGGVPKQSTSAARIDGSGVAGDSQADRRHHGRPVQAVCLWGADVIASLADDGHPIAAGNAGENVTVEGVDWASLMPGTRIDVGSVPMIITAHAIPCAKNAQWFHDRNFNRILHDRNPGQSRLYAIPLAGGEVSVGDVVTIEPVDGGFAPAPGALA